MKKMFIILFLMFFIYGCSKNNSNQIGQQNYSQSLDKQSVSSYTVRGKDIRVGMLSDDMVDLKVFFDDDLLGQEVMKDENNPGSLIVTKHYRVDDKKFDIKLARTVDPGPYRVIEILVK